MIINPLIIAHFRFNVAQGGEKCNSCGHIHRLGELYIEDTYPLVNRNCVHKTLCLTEWLSGNIELPVRENGKMVAKNKPVVPTVKATPLRKTKAGRKEWSHVHSDLVDKVVTILSAEPIRTQYGDAYVCLCDVEGENVSVLFGGTVLVSQLSDILDDLPVIARVTKPGTYYLLEDNDAEKLPESDEAPF